MEMRGGTVQRVAHLISIIRYIIRILLCAEVFLQVEVPWRYYTTARTLIRRGTASTRGSLWPWIERGVRSRRPIPCGAMAPFKFLATWQRKFP